MRDPSPERQGTWGSPWGGTTPVPGPGDGRIHPEQLPWKGAKDPLVALVVFGDYECEFTRKAAPLLDRLLDRFPDDLRLVFVHDPLRIHDHAVLAAEAAEAARMQGKFGEMHEALLEVEGKVDERDVRRLAERIGLDVERFAADLEGRARAAVATMVAFARDRKLNATPHFVVGDTVIEGARSEDRFVEAIEAALDRGRRALARGTPREEVYAHALAAVFGPE